MNPLRDQLTVVVLAGGKGERLGGVLKAGLKYQGISLLQYLLQSVSSELSGSVAQAPTVVVGDSVRLQPLVEAMPSACAIHWVSESPPFSGPVAGLQAAVQVLDSEWTLLLACYMPGASQGVHALRLAWERQEFGTDGAILVDSAGFRQPLLGCYRTEALRLALLSFNAQTSTGKGPSLRKVIARLNLAEVLAPAGSVADIDDWVDAQVWGIEKGMA